MGMDDSPNVLQCILFGALGLLALVPVFSVLCKSTALREFSAELLGQTDDDVEAQHVETARDQEAERQRRVAAYYELMFGQYYRPRPCMALRLANWRADVHCHRHSLELLPTKLQAIQLPRDPRERYEPPVIERGVENRLTSHATECHPDSEEKDDDDARSTS